MSVCVLEEAYIDLMDKFKVRRVCCVSVCEFVRVLVVCVNAC